MANPTISLLRSEAVTAIYALRCHIHLLKQEIANPTREHGAAESVMAVIDAEPLLAKLEEWDDEREEEVIDIVLSYPQVRFCRDLVDSLGARLHGFTLTFEDLDDLTHFRRKLYGIKTKTTRDYVTMTAIDRKLNAAIRKQQGSLLTRSSA